MQGYCETRAEFYTRMLAVNKGLPVLDQKCLYCGCAMGPEIFLGPVCGRCVRKNHARAFGK